MASTTTHYEYVGNNTYIERQHTIYGAEKKSYNIMLFIQ